MSIDKGLELNQRELSQDVVERAGSLGYTPQRFIAAKPNPQIWGYSTVFMTAMQDELSWLYKGDIPQEIDSTITFGYCLRTNSGFKNAGESNRHLKCFEMITLSGQMSETKMLEDVLNILKNTEFPEGTSLQANIHPDDFEAMLVLSAAGISVRISDKCDFSEPDKTDRRGHRVEIYLKNSDFEWEILNCVIITSKDHGQTQITPPIVEASGSFERWKVFIEKKDHIVKTSSFPYKEGKEMLPELPEPALLKIIELVRSILIMDVSDFTIAESANKADKLQKTYASAYHELTVFCLEIGVSLDEVKKLFEIDQSILIAMGHDLKGKSLDDIFRILDVHFERITRKIESIVSYVRRFIGELGIDESLRKALLNHDGGSPRLEGLAKHTLEQ